MTGTYAGQFAMEVSCHLVDLVISTESFLHLLQIFYSSIRQAILTAGLSIYEQIYLAITGLRDSINA